MISQKKPNIVIVIGSAPDASRSTLWDKSTHTIAAINNAWRIRSDWDYLVFPEDFPSENAPTTIQASQRLIVAKDFVPTQNTYGGFIYAGGTMAYTAAYWVLGALKPDVMAFIGCDMIYPSDGSQTHFYGNGAPDPLRDDVTLQSLEAKSIRLLALAAGQQCLCVNLSDQPTSRLMFPRMSVDQLQVLTEQGFNQHLKNLQDQLDQQRIQAALDSEEKLGYFVESGRYWEEAHLLSRVELAKIDDQWMAVLP
ncbi:hypothetical protein TUM22923_13620 [Polynucleobacter sp. TUM22923]|jgi:hypothetical protein|uniref:hypothetical protein n=1 Tax=Polynucleobacter sp. TUM22923 TaxID=3022126 RepID=UPI0025748DB6|nr:hypothetical protein [Polynucleobacter sp. TUM22923]BDX22041.1 hypothetical protein TUM22923_13620 [Polynucleobacter sp. TUM22923]